MSSGVEFEGDNWGGRKPMSPAGGGFSSSPAGGIQMNYAAYPGASQRVAGKGISGLLQRMGIAKSEKSAQYVMVGIILVNIAITAVVVFMFM